MVPLHIQTSTYTYKYSLTHLNNHLHIKTVTYFYIFLSEVRPGILERRGWILPKNLCNYLETENVLFYHTKRTDQINYPLEC